VTENIDETPLARCVLPLLRGRAGQSGVYPLLSGLSAFAARALMIEAAARTLDVQYYIWHADLSGLMLLDALRRAAERGVRVRLLLDDNGVAGLDATLAALDGLSGVEVRLYNPFVRRRLRALDYLREFHRLNRRMHNKSLVADGVATVVGGRNVGDEYFGANRQTNFADLDLLAIGEVVGEVTQAFERYWTSPSARPMTSLRIARRRDPADRLKTQLERLGGVAAASSYAQAVGSSTMLRDMLEGTLPFDWAPTRVVADDPAKTLGHLRERPGADPRMLPRLTAVVGRPRQRFDIVSPYFVPTADSARTLGELARSGVRVRVLTNSLAATDVAAVHAGYARRRRALLEEGVQLFELKPTVAAGATLRDWLHVIGGSRASLHAKTFCVDGRAAFVGSFNFDPRSVELNTEMGVVVDSPALAATLERAFEGTVTKSAYAVRLDPRGRLEWVDATGAGLERVHRTEPEAGWMKRLLVRALGRLPIERLL
jgi:putative cardiolipin synthase